MGFNLLASHATQPPTATLTMNAFLLFTACVAAVSADSDPQFYARHSYGLTAAGPILAVNQAHQAYPYHHGFPVAHAAAPAVAVHAAPVPAVAGPGPIASQYHRQDEFGNYEYGYSNIHSMKHEAGNAYTGVSGTYSYVDPNGLTQTTNYIAGGLGFRVQASNLPVGPVPEVAVEGPTEQIDLRVPAAQPVEVYTSERLPISTMAI